MRTDNKAQQPSFAETISVLIDSKLIDLHVCMPAKIESYDPSTQSASVLPSLKKKYEDGTILKWPVIPNVPVIWPRASGGESYIHLPLMQGDDVTLVFSERSLDNWKQTGMLSDPADRRKFNITDAFAIPGGSGLPLAFQVDDPNSITIKNSTSKIEISAQGQYSFTGSTGELVDILLTFMQEVAGAFTTTSLGPQPLINPSDPGFATVIAKLSGLKKG